MKNLFLITALSFAASVASASQLSCAVGIYTAADVQKDDIDPTRFDVLRLDVTNGDAEKEYKVLGEPVYMSVSKRQTVDAYDFVLSLKDKNDPKQAALTYATDVLLNDGPAKEDGWVVDYKPGAILYTFADRKHGMLTLTTQFESAMKKAGLWEKAPFFTTNLTNDDLLYVMQATKTLVSKNLLKNEDVVALVTFDSCTFNK